MRILVINCNTSSVTTAAISRVAHSAASAGTTVEAVQPEWGVASAEGFLESFISAAAVLDLLTVRAPDYDAVVMAGYGEHGREGARQLLDVPVVDITEASAQLACLLGRRFGVVTTLASAVPGIEDSLLLAGLSARCAGVAASGLPVLALDEDVPAVARALADAAEGLLAAGADVIVLGCAGMAGLDLAVEQLLGVPVVEGVAAAVGMAELLVRLGKQTSKRGAFAPPSPAKDRPGWPVSALRLKSGANSR